MHTEVAYCALCQNRVTGADLDQGRAFRAGDRILCRSCAPAEIAQAATRAGTPSLRASSTQVPRVPSTTRRAAAPDAPRSNRVPWIAGGAGLAVVLVAAVALSGGSPRPPDPPRLRLMQARGRSR